MKFKDHKCKFCGAVSKVPDGTYLRQLREKHGIGLRAMAEYIGVSAPYLSNVEKGSPGNERKCTPRVRKAYEKLEKLK